MIYWLQDPLPFEVWDESYGPQFVDDYLDYNDQFAEDGWPDPGPCPICGTPHTACVADYPG